MSQNKIKPKCNNKKCPAYDDTTKNNCWEYQEFGTVGCHTKCSTYIPEGE
jgi:hypothetical protein